MLPSVCRMDARAHASMHLPRHWARRVDEIRWNGANSIEWRDLAPVRHLTTVLCLFATRRVGPAVYSVHPRSRPSSRSMRKRHCKGQRCALCKCSEPDLFAAGFAVIAVVALDLGIGFSHVLTDLGLAIGLGTFAVVNLRFRVHPNFSISAASCRYRVGGHCFCRRHRSCFGCWRCNGGRNSCSRCRHSGSTRFCGWCRSLRKRGGSTEKANGDREGANLRFHLNFLLLWAFNI